MLPLAYFCFLLCVATSVDPSRIMTDELVDEMLDSKDFSALTGDVSFAQTLSIDQSCK